MNGPMKDWDALGADWRGQSVPALDVEALRREAGREGRRLRLTLGAETLLALLVAAFLVWVALKDGATRMETWLFGGLGLLLLPYQAYVIWLRRRELSESGLDGPALLDMELRRCATTLHYWRVGMWTAMAIWGVVYAVFWAGVLGAWSRPEVAGLFGAVLGNLVAMPLIGIYGLIRCRQVRRRRERLQGLRAQLDGF